ncbi:hypothetical protein BTVI_51408 [Pitangus sulphuratus]|nr:hypothetical protein BTVI_51408 [Pitangus sulphuratus]
MGSFLACLMGPARLAQQLESAIVSEMVGMLPPASCFGPRLMVRKYLQEENTCALDLRRFIQLSPVPRREPSFKMSKTSSSFPGANIPASEGARPVSAHRTRRNEQKGYTARKYNMRIKHENIVALEDIYESPNHLYLVMQFKEYPPPFTVQTKCLKGIFKDCVEKCDDPRDWKQDRTSGMKVVVSSTDLLSVQGFEIASNAKKMRGKTGQYCRCIGYGCPRKIHYVKENSFKI